MKIVERYLLNSFLKVFLILLSSVTLLAGVIELLERYPDISEHEPPFSKVAIYILSSLPAYGGYLLPMVSFLSIIYSLGIASKHREIVVIQASGGRLKEVFKPLVIGGIIITLLSGVFTNIVMPWSKKLSRLTLEDITGQPHRKGMLETSQGIWFRSEDKIIRIGIYEPQRSEAMDIGIYEFKDGSLISRIEAEKGILREKEWNLKNVRVYNWREPEGSRYYENFKFYTSRYALRLLKTEISPEEMDSSRLWKYIRALKKSGLRNVKVVADLNLRLSLPFACLAMLLTGMYIGSSRSISGLVGAGIGIVISIFFWFSTTFMLSLGYSGVLPAWLAPWIIPLLSTCTGIYLYSRIK
ncbi:MAG: LptF/LptG family permease [Thermodesulfovibrionales bacterium]|nr:LptF/LptG family permease [Thermodesulfovibrionales bacterium]